MMAGYQSTQQGPTRFVTKTKNQRAKRGEVVEWTRSRAQHWLDACHYAMVALHRAGWKAE